MDFLEMVHADSMREAAGLLARRGYDNVQAAGLAQAMRMSVGSMYRHYGSKRGLALAVRDFTEKQLSYQGYVAFALKHGKPGVDFAQAFLAFWWELAGWALRQPGLFNFTFLHWHAHEYGPHSPPAPGPRVAGALIAQQSNGGATRAVVREVLEKGEREGALAPGGAQVGEGLVWARWWSWRARRPSQARGWGNPRCSPRPGLSGEPWRAKKGMPGREALALLPQVKTPGCEALALLPQVKTPGREAPAHLPQVKTPGLVALAHLSQVKTPHRVAPAHLAQAKTPRLVAPAHLSQSEMPSRVASAHLHQMKTPARETLALLARAETRAPKALALLPLEKTLAPKALARPPLEKTPGREASGLLPEAATCRPPRHLAASRLPPRPR